MIGAAELATFLVVLGKLLVWLAAATGATWAAVQVFGPLPFLVRLLAACWAMWKALDIVGCTGWLGTLYPFGLADRPTGRRMISSYVGMAAANGHRWALLAAAVIDWGAMRLGDRPDHCARAFRHYRGLDG